VPDKSFNHLFIITHTDLDGVGAAAVALRLLERGEGEATILFAEPYNIDRVLEENLDSMDRGDLLVISDLGANRDALPRALESLSELSRRGVSIEWFDHHVWSPEDLEAVEKAGVRIVVDRSTCATGVVARYLMGPKRFEEDRFLSELEAVVCSADLWRWDHPLSPKLFRVVGERHGGEDWKRRLALKMASGILWDDEMESKLEEYVNLELEGYTRVLATVYVSRGGGARLAVAYKASRGPPSSSTIGALLLSRYAADVAAIVRSDGGLSLRSRKFNVQLLASKLGGGGHPKAAGAKIEIPLLVRLAGRLYPKIVSYYAFRVLSRALEELGGAEALRLEKKQPDALMPQY
jgi:oligoribonuclease NrnB/cAMP/cGMP phosphodiesterase (DHH superfamily)